MSLVLPEYWLPRPEFVLTETLREAFDDLLDRIRQTPADQQPLEIDYRLDAPRWQFLCYASEQGGLALHGSPNRTIRRFEPRQASDLNEFGAQRAIYAASDGIWPMYFAIIDREYFPTALVNACIRVEDAQGRPGPALYVFSVSREALAQQPWVRGAVYLLPRDSFVAQEPFVFGDQRIYAAQLASKQAVTPLAYLPVGAEDFPFLAQMRGHDDKRLPEYAAAMNNAQPWPADESV